MTKDLEFIFSSHVTFSFSIVIKIEWNKNSLKRDIAFAGETIPLRRRLLDNPEDAEDIMQEVF